MSGAETSDVWSDNLGEERKHFAFIVMATCLAFGVDQFVVDDDIKDAAPASDQREVINDVLIVGEKVRCCAHGVA